jgi:hypothetical protein
MEPLDADSKHDPHVAAAGSLAALESDRPISLRRSSSLVAGMVSSRKLFTAAQLNGLFTAAIPRIHAMCASLVDVDWNDPQAEPTSTLRTIDLFLQAFNHAATQHKGAKF